MDKLEKIVQRRKNKIGKSDRPFSNFITKWQISVDLLWKTNELIDDKKLIQESRRQYLVSMITAMEVYFKDTFILLIEKYKLDFRNVAKQTKNFTLEEIEYIINNKCSMGEIIAEYFNFQNLDNINKAFSELLSINFFNKIKHYKKYYTNGDFIQVYPNFYPLLKEWIELRHNFIHDINFNSKLTEDDMHKLDSHIIVFIDVIESYLDDIIYKRKKKN